MAVVAQHILISLEALGTSSYGAKVSDTLNKIELQTAEHAVIPGHHMDVNVPVHARIAKLFNGGELPDDLGAFYWEMEPDLDTDEYALNFESGDSIYIASDARITLEVPPDMRDALKGLWHSVGTVQDVRAEITQKRMPDGELISTLTSYVGKNGASVSYGARSTGGYFITCSGVDVPEILKSIGNYLEQHARAGYAEDKDLLLLSTAF